jgi:hypothetical protein
MKNIIKLILLLFIVTNTSCKNDTDDLVTGDAALGGAIVKIMPSIGKVLGSPINVDDVANTEVAFSEIKLDLNIQLQFGGEDITKYEIVKSFIKANDEVAGIESVVATGTNLPLNVSYNTIEEFMQDTEVTNSTDLRIGDQFIFRTKMYTSSGEVHYNREGVYIVTVSCASDLAGTYITSYSSGDFEHIITKIGEGHYRISAMFGWPTDPTTNMTFTDVCGTVVIEDGSWAYSNHIGGEGTVDAVTGNITFEGTFVENVYDNVSWILVKQ